MAQVKQITGLMSAPTQGYTAGFRAVAPAVDDTVSKTVTKALDSANDAVVRLAVYEREEAEARRKEEARMAARSAEIMAKRRAEEAKEALRAKQEQDKAAQKAQEEARKQADEVYVSGAMSEISTLLNGAVYGKGGLAYTTTADIMSATKWADSGGSYEVNAANKMSDIIHTVVDKAPEHLRGAIVEKAQPVFSTHMGFVIKRGGEAFSESGVQSYTANYNMELNRVGAGAGSTAGLFEYATGKAKLEGKNVDDPKVKADIQAGVKKDVSTARADHIKILVEQRDLAGAETLFAATVADNLFMPDDLNTSVKHIRELRTNVDGNAAGKAALSEHQLQTSYTGRVLRATVGIVDEDGAKRVAEVANKTAGDTEAILATMLFGDERMDALIDSAEKNKTNWRAGLTEQESRSLASSMRRFNADTTGLTPPTEQTIDRLISEANPGLNAEGKKIAKEAFAAEMERQRLEIDNRKYTSATAIFSAIEGGSDISSILGTKTSMFSDEEKNKLIKYQNRMRLGASGDYSNPAVVARFADPKKLASMSDYEFAMLKTEDISSTDFAMLTYMRQLGVEKGKELKGPSYSWEPVTRAVKNYAAQMGVKLEPEQVRIYASAIAKHVFRESRMRGGEVPEDQIISMVSSMFDSMVMPEVGIFGESKATSLINFDEDDYNDEVVDVLTKIISPPTGANLPDGALNATYASLFVFGDYDIPVGVLSDEQMEWTVNEIRKRNENYAKIMSYNDTVRAFILLKQGARTTIDKLTR